MSRNTVQPISLARPPLHIRVVGLCTIVLLLEGYDIAAVGYAVPSLVDAWRVPRETFTMSLTAGNVGIVLGSLAAGLLGDRLGRKPVLVTCVTMFGVFSLASAFSASPIQLACLRLLTGLGLGGGIPVAITLASDFAPTVSKGRLVMTTSVGVPIGFAVGGLLASQLVHTVGWPAIFAIGGAVPIAFSPVLMLRLPESHAFGTGPPQRNRLASLYSHGLAVSTVLIWAINFLSLLTTYLILLWMPAVLHGAGASSAEASSATSVYAFGLIAGILFMGSLVDGMGIERVLTFGLAFGALSLLAIGALGTRSWSLLALTFCAGFGGGSQGGINALSGLIYPPPIRATGAGWALGLGRLGGIAGPLLGGLLLAHGHQVRQIFIMAVIPALAAMVLMIVLALVRRVP
jgi:AAHS family 4-hydroxybenzoate transporter-like MFS transporter